MFAEVHAQSFFISRIRPRQRAVRPGGAEGFQVEILIAIGKQGERADLPEDIQASEQPTPRKPLAGFYAEGQFNFKE